jgi:hypothetical protein
MGFKELTTVMGIGYVQACSSVRGSNEVFLRIVARHCNARRTTILIDSGLPDDALNLVAVFQSLAQSFKDQRTNCFL